MTIDLRLPWPPTANTYWRHPGGGKHLVSKKGRIYRRTVAGLVLEQMGKPVAVTGRLAMTYQLCPPDKRRRDLSNTLKALEDAMQWACVFVDDEQIDHMTLTRCGVDPSGDGYVEVTIRELGT